MNKPSPLVPQGSFEAQAQGKSHVRIAVFTILAIHVVVLGGLLILGCKREEKPAETAANPPPPDLSAVQPFTNAVDPFPSNPPPLVPSNTSLVNTTLPPALPPSNGGILPPANNYPDAPAAEHAIVKGDTFATLATKYGVTVKAIQAANPGVNPTKLKVGQKVNIPAKSATAMAVGAPASAATSAADTYTVKSGDTLSKIAKAHGTTVKEVQKLNGMSTTQIKVNQKLKLPPQAAAASAPAAGVPAPVAVPPPASGVLPPPAQ